MTYRETVDYLYSQLPMYQRQGGAAYKADLSNTWALCDALNHPQNDFLSIHVAGTNGKGSTSHFIASILQEAGFSVGLYTSPHLIDFRERIRINGIVIPESVVVDFVAHKMDLLSDIQPSFFEWTVGLAFYYFATQKVDIAVIETGLGGRLDSTNVITPLVSVITNIGLDHTQFLGNTLSQIAIEKAGIIKPNVPVVIGEHQAQVEAVFSRIAQENKAGVIWADQSSELSDLSESIYACSFSDRFPLVPYQLKNIQTAIAAIYALKELGWSVNASHLARGVERMQMNTGLRGRWEVLRQYPLVIADTAHNKEGLRYTVQALSLLPKKSLRIVFGMVNDKDADAIIPLLPRDAIYYLCQPNIERAKPVHDLDLEFENRVAVKKIYTTVKAAYDAAISEAQDDDVIYIGGSTFVVADVLHFAANYFTNHGA